MRLHNASTKRKKNKTSSQKNPSFVDIELTKIKKPALLRQNITAVRCERLDSFQKQDKYI